MASASAESFARLRTKIYQSVSQRYTVPEWFPNGSLPIRAQLNTATTRSRTCRYRAALSGNVERFPIACMLVTDQSTNAGQWEVTSPHIVALCFNQIQELSSGR